MAARPETPSPDLDELKISPEVAWYLTSRGIPFPTCPPAFKTPEPRKVRGAKFDGARVDRVLAAFDQLRHTQGKWAGKPLRPDPWQIAYVLAPVFGWVHPDPDDRKRLVRIIRRLFVEVPRKNGKSTLLGGIGLYLTGGDDEAGAQVLVAATTKEQAGFTFKPIKQLVEKSPALKAPFKAVGLNIIHRRSGSYMQAISSVADAQHGANIHGGIVDELHVHKSPDMLDVLETGTGSRSQPLIAIITTADEAVQGSVYDNRRAKIEQLASGSIVEPAQYGVIWCADENDDPFAEETWAAANPGYGISPTRSYMQTTADAARNSPTELPTFLRLNLGIRKSSTVKWIPLDRYDVTGQMIRDDEWNGMVVRGGLDLSSSSDFTAFVMRGRSEQGAPVRAMFWLPEEQIQVLERRTNAPLRAWADAGWLRLTEGDVVDYATVRAHIKAEIERLGVHVASVAFDPWNAQETAAMLEQDGIVMVPTRQTYGCLSAPAKRLESLIIGSKPDKPLVRTGGNPILRWMADCVTVRQDESGNIKPVKPDRLKSSKRIDGVVAWIMAEREDMLAVDEQSSAQNFLDELRRATEA